MTIVYRGDAATAFFNDQCSGCPVPFLQVVFKESVQAAVGDVAELEGC